MQPTFTVILVKSKKVVDFFQLKILLLEKWFSFLVLAFLKLLEKLFANLLLLPLF